MNSGALKYGFPSHIENISGTLTVEFKQNKIIDHPILSTIIGRRTPGLRSL